MERIISVYESRYGKKIHKVLIPIKTHYKSIFEYELNGYTKEKVYNNSVILIKEI